VPHLRPSSANAHLMPHLRPMQVLQTSMCVCASSAQVPHLRGARVICGPQVQTAPAPAPLQHAAAGAWTMGVHLGLCSAWTMGMHLGLCSAWTMGVHLGLCSAWTMGMHLGRLHNLSMRGVCVCVCVRVLCTCMSVRLGRWQDLPMRLHARRVSVCLMRMHRYAPWPAPWLAHARTHPVGRGVGVCGQRSVGQRSTLTALWPRVS